MPGSNRPFLDAGEPGQRGHVNFRGRMFLESKTFGDDRVLLHIPQGFDPNRPAVMVVFFHGHGATLDADASTICGAGFSTAGVGFSMEAVWTGSMAAVRTGAREGATAATRAFAGVAGSRGTSAVRLGSK